MHVIAPPGVFRPRSDTWLLRDVVVREVRPGESFLELCCGPGVTAIGAARSGAEATAVELSWRSAMAARANARLARTRVRVRRGDLFGPVRGERFDVIAANPPYVPSPRHDHEARGAERAWVAGPSGRELIDRIADGVADHLRPGGRVLLVQSTVTGEAETLSALTSAGLGGAIVVERRRGPLGPLMREQQRTGLVDPGIDEEEVIVVRATAPA